MTTAHTMDRSYHVKTGKSSAGSYKNLFWVSLVHFIIMYAVMFTMVYSSHEIFLNLNNLYMTGMMLVPMILLMPLSMKMMYPDKKLNTGIYILTGVVFVAFYIFMRAQTFIDDKQFIRSMIPHHSGAVLMCEKATLNDPEIIRLCGDIIRSQKAEIQQMKEILTRIK